LYFLPLHRACDIGPDGHARRGGFLPPVPLPRRMWAGSRFELFSPLRVGEQVQRVSTIEAVNERQGRSGALVFVTVRHEFTAAGRAAPALREWHDIVYREEPARDAKAPAGEPAPAPDPTRPHWQRRLVPDEVLLFRYSALTFNGHRIHYDRTYATEVEHYPGLVVHGPYSQHCLIDFVRDMNRGRTITTFNMRARAPLFADAPFDLVGGPKSGEACEVFALTPAGTIAMQATATLA
jgi:3-methylfumaryl-CoA hydratase